MNTVPLPVWSHWKTFWKKIVGEIRDEYDEDEVEDIKEIQPGREYVVQGLRKA